MDSNFDFSLDTLQLISTSATLKTPDPDASDFEPTFDLEGENRFSGNQVVFTMTISAEAPDVSYDVTAESVWAMTETDDPRTAFEKHIEPVAGPILLTMLRDEISNLAAKLKAPFPNIDPSQFANLRAMSKEEPI
ncbi:hypothetical protein QVA66_10380 [Staphylococcus chromogenes]|nr:hypothetical protein [Staphylococcus chromogenes]